MNSVFDAIVDSLADNGFAIEDQFLSQNEVAGILSGDAFKSGLDHFRKAGIGKNHEQQINEAIRGDYIQWIDKNSAEPAVKIYLERLESLIAYINRTLFLSLKDYEVHMTIYPIGSYYKRHLDQFKRDDHRRLSVICYLNQNWSDEHGGQLRMHLPQGAVDVLPTAGKLVCFRSDQIEHEVLPAVKERLSITGWMLDQLAELRHL
jgi:SM-20-related protein